MASASVRDVAAAAGVSVGTVSNVLNRPEKVTPGTLGRVQEAIERLGFVRNDAARQLRGGRSRSIGLIVLNAGNPFFADLARGAEERAAEAGLSVLVGNSDENATREAAYLDLFEQQRVRGVLISPLGDTGPQLQRLRGRGIPSVLVDRQTENSTFSSVAVDDVAGGYLAVSHLVAGGRSRIAFVGGPLVLRQVADRLEGGYRAAAERGSATLEVIETGSLTVTEGRAVGERIRALPPSERPDGIFAANDLLAMGLLQALNMSGDVTVPRDIGLIGYDDIAFASAAVVPLSSIKQPSALIGYTAVDLLLQESDGGDAFEHGQIVFQPELVPRESTATGA